MDDSGKTASPSVDAYELDGELITVELNWADTVTRLLKLAREANGAFEYEHALKYLDTLSGITKGRELGAIHKQVSIEIQQVKAHALASLGHHGDAVEVYKGLLDLCDDQEHLAVRADVFNEIGQLLSKQGEYDRALGYLQRAIGVQRRLDDRVGVCKALRNLSVTYLELGELSEAELSLKEAIDLASQSTDQTLYADLVNNLGVIMNMMGEWRQALDYYRESLNIYRSHDQIRKAAYTENNLAITLAEQGLIDDAFEYLQKAYRTSSQINDSSLQLIININLADTYLKRGKPDLARGHCTVAQAYLEKTQAVNSQLVETLKLSGKIEATDNQTEAAMVAFDSALEKSRQIGARFLEADTLLERGALHQKNGRMFDALNDLEESYRIYTSLTADGKKEETEQVINSIEEMHLQIFDGLGQQVDQKDSYTKGHSDRVASLALLLGKELGLKAMALKTIVAAGLLHDIGKIDISDDILKKPGKLTDSEYLAIQKHPEDGVAMLRGKEFPWDLKPTILHHHERFDGTGYPLGLRGEDIPLGARMICIADVFDAMTSDRVYRPAFEVDKALLMMEEDAGSVFDSVLLKCFCRMIRDGNADFVINSKSSNDELFSIWMKCMPGAAPNGPEKLDSLVK